MPERRRGSRSPPSVPGFVTAAEHAQRHAATAPHERGRVSSRQEMERPAASPDTRVPLDSLPIDPRVAGVIRGQGITDLYPPQADALRPTLEGKSVVLACPTSSGKSLVAYTALASAALSGRRGIYIVPLRALASEKYRDLKAFEPLGLKVALTMGERDLSSRELENVDLLVSTSEKADSLLRHRSPWMDRVGVVVADEVHLLRDPSRGPTLEVSLTRLLRRHRGLQVLALSATVGNSAELARWLKAELVQSSFRPVALRQGVYRDGRITFTDGSYRSIEERGDPLEALVADILREGGQALVFVNSRRSTVAVATRLAKVVERSLSPSDQEKLPELARSLGGEAEEETEGLRQLASLVPKGVAFHNASLTNEERGVVEQAFRDRLLKALVATTTLAAGLNLPARRVIVRDTTRYDEHLGLSVKLPALEVHQMLGRAGRPRLDPYGEAVLLAKNIDEEEDHLDRYLNATPEDVESQLGAEAVLRTHLLALVASHEVATEAELRVFLDATFYGHSASFAQLQGELGRARNFLERWGLLERGTHLRATAFGQLASDLYLDPVTAVLLRRALERASSQTPPFHIFLALALTPDLAPLSVRNAEDEALLVSRLEGSRSKLLIPEEEDELVPSADAYLGSVKTAALLEAWTDDGRRLREITEAFGVGAGDLRARVERAEWLLSSMSLLAARERRALARPLDLLAVQVRYGIRPELLDLVGLRGVGRVRSRLLFEAGFVDVASLADAPEQTVARVLGSPALARTILAQARRRGSAGVGSSSLRSGSPSEPDRPGRGISTEEGPPPVPLDGGRWSDA